MRPSTIFAVMISIFFASGSVCVMAQSPTAPNDDTADVELPSGIEATPEMWMYLHEQKRFQDPKDAVRRKAIIRSQQRQSRLESQKWYGHSKLRPKASAIPQMSVFYGQQWGGLPWSHNQWTPYATTYSRHAGFYTNRYYYPSVRIATRP